MQPPPGLPDGLLVGGQRVGVGLLVLADSERRVLDRQTAGRLDGGVLGSPGAAGGDLVAGEAVVVDRPELTGDDAVGDVERQDGCLGVEGVPGPVEQRAGVAPLQEEPHVRFGADLEGVEEYLLLLDAERGGEGGLAVEAEGDALLGGDPAYAGSRRSLRGGRTGPGRRRRRLAPRGPRV